MKVLFLTSLLILILNNAYAQKESLRTEYVNLWKVKVIFVTQNVNQGNCKLGLICKRKLIYNICN